MKIALVCDASYQMLNAMNIVYHLKQNYRDPSKVYNLKSAQELEPTLKKLCSLVSEKRLFH